MTTFGLVHGAWHGAWCWDRLIPELQRLGHEAVAPDLPCDDPQAGFSDYADIAVEALAPHQDDLVLVAHSLGGLTLPIAAQRLRPRHQVYLCALIPEPGRAFAEQLQDDAGMLRREEYLPGLSGPDAQGRTTWSDFEIARRTFYGDCDEADARWAFDRLRPQAHAPYAEACPLQELPDVPTTYVLCTEDGIVRADWSRRTVPERLGVEPVELPGSHSPFLSRPADLAQLLARCA